MTTLACIRLLKPAAVGKKGDKRTLESQTHDVNCRNVADTDRHLVFSVRGRVVYIYVTGLCAKLSGCVEGPRVSINIKRSIFLCVCMHVILFQ